MGWPPPQPSSYDESMYVMSLRLVPYAALLHFAFGIWFYGAHHRERQTPQPVKRRPFRDAHAHVVGMRRSCGSRITLRGAHASVISYEQHMGITHASHMHRAS